MGLIEKIARLISEQDRIEADEAADFADWHWEEREELATAILALVRAELIAAETMAAPTHSTFAT